MSRCNANPCCSDPAFCKIPLPQDKTGLFHLNKRENFVECETCNGSGRGNGVVGECTECNGFGNVRELS